MSFSNLNPFLLYFESLYFLYMLEEDGVCVWVDVYMWQSASAVWLHQPHLICETSHWTWGSRTETKLAGQQASGNLPFYFPSTGELLGLQEPIITLAIMWEQGFQMQVLMLAWASTSPTNPRSSPMRAYYGLEVRCAYNKQILYKGLPNSLQQKIFKLIQLKR